MINDSRIFLAFAVTCLTTGIFFGSVSLYSKLTVERSASSMRNETEINGNTIKKAYILLRDPQVFGGYEYFDSEGITVKNTLRYLDSKIFTGSKIEEKDAQYVSLLLHRRKLGSDLGMKTALFFTFLSVLGAAAYIRERKGHLRN